MTLKLNPAKFLNFLRKKTRANLLAGTLLFVAALVSLSPGAIHLANGVSSLPFSIFTVNEYISIVAFSLAIMLVSLVLFIAAYLLWEGHSLGWKLSSAVTAAAIVLAVTIPGLVYFAILIALLTGLAVIIEIRQGRAIGNHFKDSPIVTENIVKLGLLLSVIYV